MRNRLVIAAFAASLLAAAGSAASAAETPDHVSLAASQISEHTVPCGSASAFAVAYAARPGDGCDAAFDELFPGALAKVAPLAALSGTESSGSATIKLTDSVALDLGASTLAPQSFSPSLTAPSTQAAALPLARSSFAGVHWKVAPWASLSAVASQSTADDPLDKQRMSALALAKAAKSVAVGASMRLGGNWVTTISYRQGTSQLNLRSGSLLDDGDLLRGRSYGFSIAKRGLFGNNDAMDFGITRRFQAYSNLNLDPEADGGPFGRSNIFTVPETDFEVGYVTTFLDGALALQANAAYQTNVAGQNGQNALTVLSRAKINF